MSNIRRRSILKTRTSLGVFDQNQTTNDLFAETFQIPSNDPTTNLYPTGSGYSGDLPTATTTATLPILKRRVSFSAKNQVKDISVETESDQSGDTSNFDSPSISMDLNKTTRDAEDIDMELTGCDLNETTDHNMEQMDHHHNSTINNMHKDMSIDDLNKDDSTTRFDLLDLINQTYRSTAALTTTITGLNMEITNNTNRHDPLLQINNNGLSIENNNKNESTKLSLKPMDLTKPIVSSEPEGAGNSAIDMDMTDNGPGGASPQMTNVTNKADMSMDFGDKSGGVNESIRSELNQTVAGDKSMVLDATDMEMTNCEFNEPEEEKNDTTNANKTNFDVRTLSFTQICESSESLRLTNVEVEVEEILNTMNKDTSTVSNTDKSRNSLNVQSIKDPSPEPTGTEAQTGPTGTQIQTGPTGTQAQNGPTTGTQIEPIKLDKIAQDTDGKIANCKPRPELRKSVSNNKVQKIIQNLESRSAANVNVNPPVLKKINIPHNPAFYPARPHLNPPIQTSRIRFPGSTSSKMESLSLFSTAKTPRRPCPVTFASVGHGTIGNNNSNNTNPLSKLVTRPQFSITEVQTSPQLMESEFQKWRKTVPRTPQQAEKTLPRVKRGIEIEIQTTFSELKDEDIKVSSSSQTGPGKETGENCPEIVDFGSNSPAPAAILENDSCKVFENLQELLLSTSTTNTTTTMNNSPAPAAVILENDEKVLENLQKLLLSTSTTMNNSPVPVPAVILEENDENSPKVFENLQELLLSTSNTTTTTMNNSPATEFKNLFEKMGSSESPLKDISNNSRCSPVDKVGPIESELIKIDQVTTTTTTAELKLKDQHISSQNENENETESYLSISHFQESIHQRSSATFQLSSCGLENKMIQSQNATLQQVELLRDVTHNVTPPNVPRIEKEIENMDKIQIENDNILMGQLENHVLMGQIDIENEDVQMDEVDQIDVNVSMGQTLMNKSGNNLSVIFEDVNNSPAHKKLRMQLSTPQRAVGVAQPKPQPDKPESESDSESAVKVHKVPSATNLTAEKLMISWRNLSGLEKIEAIEKAQRNIVKLPVEEFEKLLEDSKEDFSDFLVSSFKKARELEDLLENTPESSEDSRLKEYLQGWSNDNYFSTLAVI